MGSWIHGCGSVASVLSVEHERAVAHQRPQRQRNLWIDAWYSFVRNRLALAALIFILFVLLAAIFGPMISPYSYTKQDLFNVAQPPSADHWFGTDALGRDFLTRIMMGGRTAFLVAVVVTGVTATLGILIGAFSAFRGGLTDSVIMRFTDVIISFPHLLLAMFIAGTVRPQIARVTNDISWLRRSTMLDYLTVFGALAIVSWPWYARLVRGQVLSLSQMEFIEAERMIGASTSRIIRHHLVPNAIGPVIVAASVSFGQAMLLESSLSFLGIGIKPPGASWGNMISDALISWRQQPFLLAMPGIVLSLVVLAFNFLGDGINDALNPRDRR
jgi:ABC-type dipeptide/oligopeptide/nickel transport system permease subunit